MAKWYIEQILSLPAFVKAPFAQEIVDVIYSSSIFYLFAVISGVKSWNRGMRCMSYYILFTWW